MVNTSQQVGGSIGTALLNTIAATATTAYVTAHVPPTPGVIADGAWLNEVEKYESEVLSKR